MVDGLPHPTNATPNTNATNNLFISLIFLSILKDKNNINASQAFYQKSFRKVTGIVLATLYPEALLIATQHLEPIDERAH